MPKLRMIFGRGWTLRDRPIRPQHYKKCKCWTRVAHVLDTCCTDGCQHFSQHFFPTRVQHFLGRCATRVGHELRSNLGNKKKGIVNNISWDHVGQMLGKMLESGWTWVGSVPTSFPTKVTRGLESCWRKKLASSWNRSNILSKISWNGVGQILSLMSRRTNLRVPSITMILCYSS